MLRPGGRPTCVPVDLAARTSEEIADKQYGRYQQGRQPAVLPDGRVLFLDYGHVGDLYEPQPGAAGRFFGLTAQGIPNSAGHTCTDDIGDRCRILAALSDGTILVARTYPTVSVLFDSTETDVTKQWSDTRFAINGPHSGGFSVHLTRAPCGMNCNSVLMVSEGNEAELYRP